MKQYVVLKRTLDRVPLNVYGPMDFDRAASLVRYADHSYEWLIMPLEWQ